MTNKNTQINQLKNFIKSTENNLLIHEFNDRVIAFYNNLIKNFANDNNFKISTDENEELVSDLFGSQRLNIYKTTNLKKIENLIKNNNKKIIITDYKNYKKYKNILLTINTYEFEQDIKVYIQDELKINNNDLILFCKNNPLLVFSETSKYLINDINYINDQKIIEDKNHILDIRKSIYSFKKNTSAIKDLYTYIKDEAKYKKLNFLVY